VDSPVALSGQQIAARIVANELNQETNCCIEQGISQDYPAETPVAVQPKQKEKRLPWRTIHKAVLGAWYPCRHSGNS
jgi:hypothetical protein